MPLRDDVMYSSSSSTSLCPVAEALALAKRVVGHVAVLKVAWMAIGHRPVSVCSCWIKNVAVGRLSDWEDAEEDDW